MKYLHTFCVAVGSLAKKLQAISVDRRLRKPQTRTEIDDEGDELEKIVVYVSTVNPAVAAMHRVITSAIWHKKNVDSVGYYSCVMDGWDATHREVAEWVRLHRPERSKVWDDYVTNGFMLFDRRNLSLAAAPMTERQIARFRKVHKIHDYAIKAYFDSLAAAVSFAQSIKSSRLLVASSLVGKTLGDDEYK